MSLGAGHTVSALSSDGQLGDNSRGGPDASLQSPFFRLPIGGVDVSEDEE
ncbi:hypothetical protein [Salinibacter altiplanensis]|nr:hypothetical protein [Salinibacter altiplanensis]